jgi:hypothetical protein
MLGFFAWALQYKVLLCLILLKDYRRKIIDRGLGSLFVLPALQTIFHLCIPQKEFSQASNIN